MYYIRYQCICVRNNTYVNVYGNDTGSYNNTQ